ncbi:hypothetical protein DFH06DRAFT_507547 [Mycena polygramma]|nr:hypothetical protein DFH06DRAFT_507547 [Mycena polygramma]
MDNSSTQTPTKQTAKPAAITSTPHSVGAASNPTSDTHPTQTKYAPYLAEDLAKEVSLTLEDFLTHILHVPSGPKDTARLGKLVEDAQFKKLLKTYEEVKIAGTHESVLYQPFVELANYCLKVLGLDQTLVFCRNDPQFVQGSNSNRKPDVLTVHPDVLKRLSQSAGVRRAAPVKMAGKGPSPPFHWREVRAFWEFKPNDVADPVVPVIKPASEPRQAKPPKVAKSSTSKPKSTEPPSDRVTRSKSKAPSTSTNSPQPASQEPVASGSSRPASQKSATGSMGNTASQSALTSVPEKSPKLQCASYALELLSNGGLRSHVIGVLVSLHSLELLYYDHSIVIKSERLRFVENPALFVSVLLSFGNLTPAEWGYPSFLKSPTPHLLPENQHFSPDMYANHTLELDGWTLELGSIIFRAHGIIGRGTVVVQAKVIKCPPGNGLTDPDVVVKLSWVARTRVSEVEFVQTAIRHATQEPGGGMEKHLPAIYHYEEIEHGAPQTQAFLVRHFQNEYEDRVLRVIVQEVLRPIEQLTDPNELAVAFMGVVKCHRWLYEKPKILHRDVSINNLMFRKVDGKVYGVLNDYDLAEFHDRDSPPASKQRTGTRPYMAADLLVPIPPKHLFRHDLESFFYVLVFLTCNLKGSELDTWTVLGMAALKNSKESAMTHGFPPQKNEFAKFYGWVARLMLMFSTGGANRTAHKHALVRESLGGPKPVTFDDATLGGAVTFDNFEAALDSNNLAPRM